MKAGRTWIVALVIGSCLFLLASCMYPAATKEDRMVDEKNRIAILEAGQQENTWESADLTVDYGYVLEAGSIDLSGAIHFNRSLSGNFDTLVDFTCKVHFVDPDGRIIGDQWLASSGHRQRFASISFSKRIVLPAETAAMVFSYRGSAEIGSGQSPRERRRGTNVKNFWKNPAS